MTNAWWAWPAAIIAVLPGMLLGLVVTWIVVTALIAAV